jgi:hypothetical protein
MQVWNYGNWQPHHRPDEDQLQSITSMAVHHHLSFEEMRLMQGPPGSLNVTEASIGANSPHLHDAHQALARAQEWCAIHAMNFAPKQSTVPSTPNESNKLIYNILVCLIFRQGGAVRPSKKQHFLRQISRRRAVR